MDPYHIPRLTVYTRTRRRSQGSPPCETETFYKVGDDGVWMTSSEYYHWKSWYLNEVRQSLEESLADDQPLDRKEELDIPSK